jgi:long-chain acyl-CoA synthetase
VDDASTESPSSIGDLLRRAAAARGDALAVVDGSSRCSWAELEQRVGHCATALAGAGLRPGDRIALQAPTGLDFVIVYLGALRAGLVVVPVNPAYTLAELSHILDDCGAGMLVTASVSVVAAAAELLARHPALQRVVVAARTGIDEVPSVAELLAAGRDGSAIDADRTGEDLAVLLYTSGTSGRPKGAMLPVRALLANLTQFAELDPPPVSASDVLFLPLPLFHVFGLNAGLGLALHFGATVVLEGRFDAVAGLATIRDERVTVVMGAPLEFAVWAQTDGFASAFGAPGSTVRFGLAGSAPLPADLVATYAEQGVPLFEGYGLTEAAPVVTVNLVTDAELPARWQPPKAGSIGRPLPGVEVRLLDSDGEVVEAGDLGTLEVRGANLFTGYWPDGTDGPVASEDPAEDGWFATGDLAVADDDGDYYLVGRRSDLVLVNGFNVYPAEVEAVFSRLAGVAEVAVLGEADDGEPETVVAYVVPAAGTVLDPEELLAEAGRSLARFKLPRRIVEVEALPHTATGKVMKWRLPTTR